MATIFIYLGARSFYKTSCKYAPPPITFKMSNILDLISLPPLDLSFPSPYTATMYPKKKQIFLGFETVGSGHGNKINNFLDAKFTSGSMFNLRDASSEN